MQEWSEDEFLVVKLRECGPRKLHREASDRHRCGQKVVRELPFQLFVECNAFFKFEPELRVRGVIGYEECCGTVPAPRADPERAQSEQGKCTSVPARPSVRKNDHKEVGGPRLTKDETNVPECLGGPEGICGLIVVICDGPEHVENGVQSDQAVSRYLWSGDMAVLRHLNKTLDVCRSYAGEDSGRNPRGQSDCNSESNHPADDATGEGGWSWVDQKSKGDGVSAQNEEEAGKKVFVPEHWRENDA